MADGIVIQHGGWNCNKGELKIDTIAAHCYGCWGVIRAVLDIGEMSVTKPVSLGLLQLNTITLAEIGT
ncbi:hypothetical protein DPMN_115173 [Dreissena polymorpha]|uniref:Uncharacterized protein n=1 Tax=Dreissena polymorpha TaxID=45954 RepID=A0A9D4KKQ5_DREPO|nr:hypothetical protein DPMN_115173 [Dreissena polymorpha]